jgi:hypothetical protein
MSSTGMPARPAWFSNIRIIGVNYNIKFKGEFGVTDFR